MPRRDNMLSEPGEPVTRLDYESLLEQVDVTPTGADDIVGDLPTDRDQHADDVGQ